jgi:hypothetical protein
MLMVVASAMAISIRLLMNTVKILSAITLNTTGKTTNKFIDLFANNKARTEGQKRKLEKDNEEREKRAKQLDSLLEIGAVTSGQLCLGNHWVLNEAVCDAMQAKYDKDEEKKRIVNEKKSSQVQDEQDKFRASFQRYIQNETLKSEDYRTLLRRFKRSDDSPLRSKVGELMQQWHQRKHRLEDFVPTPAPAGEIHCVRETLQPPAGIFSDSEMSRTMGGGVQVFDES